MRAVRTVPPGAIDIVPRTLDLQGDYTDHIAARPILISPAAIADCFLLAIGITRVSGRRC